MNDAAQTIDLQELQAARDHLDGLRTRGWDIRHETAGVVQAVSEAASLELLEDLRVLRRAYLSVTLQGRLGDHSIILTEAEKSGLSVSELPALLPTELFEDADHATARQVWDGRVDEVFSLPLAWTVSAQLDLSRLVDPQADLIFRVRAEATEMVQELLDCSLDQLRGRLPGSGRAIYIALRGSQSELHLGSVSFISLESLATPLVSIPSRPAPLAAESSRAAAWNLPNTTELLPQTSDGKSDLLTEWARASAVLLFWANAAESHSTVAGVTSVEFLGLKRKTLQLPAHSQLTSQDVVDTLQLHAWTFADDNPDRLLALSQVVSVYDGAPPFSAASDVFKSAKLIYQGLRSKLIAEIATTRRSAQASAQDAARVAGRSTTDLVKGAQDRILASLVGIGGILVGRSTLTLDEEVSRLLMLIVAAFLFALAISAVTFESRVVVAPLETLEDDLRRGHALLAPDQIDDVLESDSVSLARRQAMTIRWAAFSIYVALGLAIVIFGHPGDFV